jgi:hypothetical protein
MRPRGSPAVEKREGLRHDAVGVHVDGRDSPAPDEDRPSPGRAPRGGLARDVDQPAAHKQDAGCDISQKPATRAWPLEPRFAGFVSFGVRTW